jgi:hypothetical protein
MSLTSKVIRERQTEETIRRLDTHEIVDMVISFEDTEEKLREVLEDLVCECHYLSCHEVDGGAPDNRWDDMRTSLAKAMEILK